VKARASRRRSAKRLFPPLIVHMVAVGERSGQLEEMLGKAADAYDDEVENAVAALTTILEPLHQRVHGRCRSLHRAYHPAAEPAELNRIVK
jgi:hypothetical protein